MPTSQERVDAATKRYTESASYKRVQERLLARGIVPKNFLETPQGLEVYAKSKGVEVPPKQKVVNALKRTAGVLNVGTAFTAGLLRGALDPDQSALGSAFSAAGESLAGREMLGFSDVARQNGITPTSRGGKIALGTAGFIADVVFDPLTYLTFGIGAGVKIGTKTLSRTGTKVLQETATGLASKLGKEEAIRLGRELTERELADIGKTAARRSEIAIEEAVGKKGINTKSIERLRAEGFDPETISEIATRAPKLLDEGGIKMFGQTLLSNKLLAKTPLGKAAKILGQTEIAQALKNSIGKAFVADFGRSPKIVALLDKGSRQIRNATQEIIKKNESLFKGISEKQASEFFDTVFSKKMQIAEAGQKVDPALRGADKLAAKSTLRQEAKATQRGERLLFEDPRLQQLADELFEVKKILRDGKTIEVPGVVARFAKLAGLPEKDAIKFYIPSKFKDKLEIRNAAFGRSGVGSPNLDFLKEFTGVKNDELIKDPFEAFSRGQIAVATARIKTNTIEAVVRELGLSAKEVARRGLSPQDLERLGYVKFNKKGLESAEKYTKRVTAMVEMKALRESLKKSLKELKLSKGADRETISQINNLEKEIANLFDTEAENLSKFFSGDAAITEKITKGSRRLGTLPPQLEEIANEIRKVKEYNPSIKLESMYEDGVLERAGFNTIDGFIDYVKNPYKRTLGKDALSVGRLSDSAGFKVNQKDLKVGDEIISGTRKPTDDVEEKLFAEKLARQDLPLKSRILETANPKSIKISVKELDLLKDKFKNFNKGYKFANNETKEIQGKIIKIIKDNFDLKDRGQFLTSLKNVNSREGAENLVDILKNKFEDVVMKREEEVVSKMIQKVVSVQKNIERLQPKLATVKEIDKKSIDDSLSYLDNAIEGINARRAEIKGGGDLQRKIEGWIPKAVSEELTKMMEPKLSVIDDLARASGFDYVTGIFKGYVTSIFPGFHVRNMTSNQFQNFLKIGVDAVNPSMQKKALDIMRGANLNQILVTKTGKHISLGDIRKQVMKESDILEAGAFGRTEQFLEDASTRLAGGRNLNRYNPLSRDNVALQFGRKIGSAAEGQSKLVSVVSAVMEGKTVKEGVKQAEEALFNYSKLSEFERSVMRRIIPFYTFARKNAELQIKTLATNPGRIATEMKAIGGVGEAIGEPISEEEKEGLPSFVLRNLGIKGPGVNKYGQPEFFTGLGLPIEEFLGRFSGEKGVVANTILNLMAQSNPIIKFPTERATGVDFFRGRPITEISNGDSLKVLIDGLEKASPKAAQEFKDLIQWSEIKGKPVYVNGKIVDYVTKYTANPFVLHFARNLFTSRIQSTVGFLSAEDQTAYMKALKFFTGVKGWAIDVEQQKFYNDLARKRELEDMLIRMGLGGNFEKFFIPKNQTTNKE